MLTSDQIRTLFIEFFVKNGHHLTPSAPLSTQDDSLLFNNAGMVPFRDIFLGKQKPQHDPVVSIQKCLRVSGKHNDLEDVGNTPRHHTFFEMMGNFSFQNYGREEAIHYAWTFLTQILKIPKEKLWVTVFEEDEASYCIWKKHQVDQLIKSGKKDNFWQMGNVGPCGPCTEIYYDHGENVAGTLPGDTHTGSRYVEIWNIVFIENYQDAEGSIFKNKQLGVDTGMGFERLVAVMQGQVDNYLSDVFQPYFKAILACHPIRTPHSAMAVMADHMRAAKHLIEEGVMPSNEKRGYVVRKLIRRASLYSQRIDMKRLFLHEILENIGVDPKISSIISKEEKFYHQTIQKAKKLFEEARGNYRSCIPGEVMCKWYTTHGLPLEIMQEMAEKHQLTLDVAGFKQYMQKEKIISKQ